MLNTKLRRFAALLGVVGLLASAIGLTVAGTGAYFTASHPGQINGTFGAVSVNVNGGGSGPDNLQLNFAGMLPGQFRTANIVVTNTGTDTEDIFIAFDNTNSTWSNVNTLGTFGEFVVNGSDYNNLNNHYPQGTAASGTNPCGDPNPAIAYLPHVQGVGQLAPGASGTYVVQFRFSACISNNAYQNQPIFTAPLLFSIVATQQGILPSDVHNGAGTIAPLTLASGYYQ